MAMAHHGGGPLCSGPAGDGPGPEVASARRQASLQHPATIEEEFLVSPANHLLGPLGGRRAPATGMGGRKGHLRPRRYRQRSHPGEVRPRHRGPGMEVGCVHGVVQAYPTVTIEVCTPKGAFKVEARVVPNLPVPLHVGRDCPIFPGCSMGRWKAGTNPGV